MQQFINKIKNTSLLKNTISSDIVNQKFSQYGLSIDESIDYEYVDKKMRRDVSEILMHNLHHYILATPERRLMPEFGLGTPPTSPSTKNKKPIIRTDSIISDKNTQYEEELVACLDYLSAFHNGYSLNYIQYNFTTLTKNINDLYQMGIITKTGKFRKNALRKK